MYCVSFHGDPHLYISYFQIAVLCSLLAQAKYFVVTRQAPIGQTQALKLWMFTRVHCSISSILESLPDSRLQAYFICQSPSRCLIQSFATSVPPDQGYFRANVQKIAQRYQKTVQITPATADPDVCKWFGLHAVANPLPRCTCNFGNVNRW